MDATTRRRSTRVDLLNQRGLFETVAEPGVPQVCLDLLDDRTGGIESKPITLRTRSKRLVRRTICFSKATTMHDLVIGLFINRYERLSENLFALPQRDQAASLR